MRVLIDATFVAGHRWGVHRAVGGLLRGLRQLDREARYQALVGSEEDFDAWGGPIEPLVQAETRRSSWRRLVWQHRRLPRLLAELRPDVFHAARYVGPWQCPVPMVATVYDVLALTSPELVRAGNRWHYRFALPRTIRQAAKVIVPSEWTAGEVRRVVETPKGKIVVAPLGVDEEEMPGAVEAKAARVRAKYALVERFVLFVGHIEPKKNVPATVRAFAKARQRAGLPHELVLAGTPGWGWAEVERACREAGAGEFVRALGRVPQEDLAGLYAAAELLVHWSLAEGFGLTPLEAMRVGTAVLCSEEGALPEVVGDAAARVPVGQPQEFAAELERLLGDETARAGLVEKGRVRAAQYTWRRHAEIVFEAYQEVAGGG